MTVQTIEKIDRKVGKQVIAAMGVPAPDPWFTQNAQDKKKIDNSIKTWAENFTNYVFGDQKQTVTNAGQYLAGGFGGAGTNTFEKTAKKIVQTDIKGNKRTFFMDGSRASLAAVVQASGIPVEYQDKTVQYLMDFKGNRVANDFDARAVSTDRDVAAPPAAP
jgi:hypothetical protein